MAWIRARTGLVSDLKRVVLAGPSRVRPDLRGSAPALAADLAGLTTAADWIGSNADVFLYTTSDCGVDAYWALARERAANATAAAGFRASPAPSSRRSFQELFRRDPWPLHSCFTEVLATLPMGSLAIVEAPMGEGKTEAAFLAFDTLATRGADGLYFALPTQATANQILGRIERFLSECFPGAHNLHLVHGGAALSDAYGELAARALSLRSIDGPATDRDDAPVADAWFRQSKRALLAPFGVGTVDQALLSVLRSRHHFLRLHGLAGKVVVFDEVHAYDAFTSTLLARLCEWLRALGATVVLLSATLASPQRERLLRAFGAAPPASVPYPAVTVVTDGVATPQTFPSKSEAFGVRLEWKGRQDILGGLIEATRAGGNVAWIVNTVSTAQALFLELEAAKSSGAIGHDVELRLLHARLPFGVRLRREQEAGRAYGPPSDDPNRQRPRASILVGTQVLEQSLDFDFDLMVTEIAPVDLVLQRAGRLHRHARPRLPHLQERALWIETPNGADASAGPTFGAASYVYDEGVLLATYLALWGRDHLRLPNDIPKLIEDVYATDWAAAHPEGPLRARLVELAASLHDATRGEARTALDKLLPSPSSDDPFANFACRFDEEDPAVHEALRAVTRLGDRSVTVVPVVPHEAELRLATDLSFRFDPRQEQLPFAVVQKLARSSVSISRPQIVSALLASDESYPRAFRRSGFLRHHRLLVLDCAGRGLIGSTPLALDPALGLVIGKLTDQLSAARTRT
ncbi:MAG: CRISPR-associated helicase Cas3' [Polyangiaceae bacterium]